MASTNGTTGALKPETQPENAVISNPEDIHMETVGTDPQSKTITSPEKKWPGWPGECVFRIIVPVLKVGSIIGRKGDIIKKMCEDTKARIRVLDAPLGTPDRIVSFHFLSFTIHNDMCFYQMLDFVISVCICKP